MINELLNSPLFNVFLDEKIQESKKCFWDMLNHKPMETGFYIIKRIDKQCYEIVFLSNYGIENQKFRESINSHLKFSEVEYFSHINIQ